jgi:acyl-coenzyme A thioesterase PaaI-like protein
MTLLQRSGSSSSLLEDPVVVSTSTTASTTTDVVAADPTAATTNRACDNDDDDGNSNHGDDEGQDRQQSTLSSSVTQQQEQQGRSRFGERLCLPEWDDPHHCRHHRANSDTDAAATATSNSRWKGRDMVHDRDAPVRITDYYVRYPSRSAGAAGGTGTVLTGLVHFTDRAESHAGLCHGGAVCAVLDDVVGWTAFCATGTVVPWSGFTVQVNVKLQRPVPVGSAALLRVQGRIARVERRKVFVRARLLLARSALPSGGDEAWEEEEDDDKDAYAICDGIVVLNKGVLV